MLILNLLKINIFHTIIYNIIVEDVLHRQNYETCLHHFSYRFMSLLNSLTLKVNLQIKYKIYLETTHLAYSQNDLS